MSNDRWHRITLGIPPQKQEPKDVREMRQIIDRIGMDCPIINSTECTARHLGLSGEDKYTLLAYSALLELHRIYNSNMEYMLNSTVRTVFIKQEESPIKGGLGT